MEILDEITDGEISGVALPVIAVLLAKLKSRHICYGKDFTPIATSFEDGLDHFFVLPCEAAKKDRNLLTFVGCKRTLHRFREMLCRFGGKTALPKQALSFCSNELKDFFL